MAEKYGGLQKYRSSNPVQQFLIRKFLKKTCGIVQNLPPGPFCDVGCGEGFALRNLLDQHAMAGMVVTAVDIDPKALEYAAGLVPEAVLKQASAYELPFRNSEFRTVMMLEVLEHLEFPEKAIREASRVGEYLLISVPHEPWFRIANFLRGKNWARWGNDLEHVHWWGIGSLRRLIGPYGKIVRFETSFPWIIALLRTTDRSCQTTV